MHPVTLGYFMRNPPSIIPGDPHQVFFSESDGFSCYAWLPWRPAWYGWRLTMSQQDLTHRLADYRRRLEKDGDAGSAALLRALIAEIEEFAPPKTATPAARPRARVRTSFPPLRRGAPGARIARPC
jgi:hypothetical protein